MSKHASTSHEPSNIPSVRTVPPGSVLRWIKLGWSDFVRSGYPSFLHGLLVFVSSVAVVMVTFLYWPILPGAVSGFLLVGPILATGLYALSRSLEQNKSPQLKDSISAWRNGCRCLFQLGSLLVLFGAAWVGVTVLLFRLFVKAKITNSEDFIYYVFVQNDLHFILWTVLGGLGLALVYSLTVVSVPLLIDRKIKTKEAILTSVRVVGENPVTMGLWAFFLLVATGLSLLTLMLGFIVLYPVMGHASWHVYRDLVDADSLPSREQE